MPAPRRPTTFSCTGPLPQHCIHTYILQEAAGSFSGWLPPDCRPWPGIVLSLSVRASPPRVRPAVVVPETCQAEPSLLPVSLYYQSFTSSRASHKILFLACLPLLFTGHDLHHPSIVAWPAQLLCPATALAASTRALLSSMTASPHLCLPPQIHRLLLSPKHPCCSHHHGYPTTPGQLA